MMSILVAYTLLIMLIAVIFPCVVYLFCENRYELFGVSIAILILSINLLFSVSFGGDVKISEIKVTLTSVPEDTGIIQIAKWMENNKEMRQRTIGYFDSDVVLLKSQYWYYFICNIPTYEIVKK